MTPKLAPCVAVVGPPNSGKSSLIDLLDHALQHHPDQPTLHVVKGNPDGSGRYLLHAPEMREALKPEIKGNWIRTTSAIICEWIANSRNAIELVLVDLGGGHDEANEFILQHCSHYIAISRRFDDATEEARQGLDSWIHVCRRNGLKPVAHLTSVIDAGQPSVDEADDGVLVGTFRGDARELQNLLNQPVLDVLVRRLLSLRTIRPEPNYINLKLERRWAPEDLADLAGLAPIVNRAAASGNIAFGGTAPIWAYLAAMMRALDRAPSSRFWVFDPKVICGLVEIPPKPIPDAASPLAQALEVRWEASSANSDGTALSIKVITDDHFLHPMAFAHLPTAPAPPEPPPTGALWLYGPVPIWLHLTYARWLRASLGTRALGIWDARLKRPIFPTGPGSHLA